MIAMDRRIGERLEARRLEMGLSEADLALSLGIAIADLHEVVAGRRRLALGEMTRACCALDVGVPYFFAGGPSETAEPADPPQALPSVAVSG